MAADGHAAAVAAIAARLAMDAAFDHEAALSAHAGDDAKRAARLACTMRAAAYRARVRELGAIGSAQPAVLDVLEEITAEQARGTRLRVLLAECRRMTRDAVTDDTITDDGGSAA